MTLHKRRSAVVPPPVTTARDRRLERLIDHLPWRVGSVVRWLRRPSSFWIRMPAGALLICGGLVSFLPIFSLWMLPLGLLLLAEDVPPLRSATSRVLDWIEHRHPQWLAARRADKPNAKLENELRS